MVILKLKHLSSPSSQPIAASIIIFVISIEPVFWKVLRGNFSGFISTTLSEVFQMEIQHQCQNLP